MKYTADKFTDGCSLEEEDDGYQYEFFKAMVIITFVFPVALIIAAALISLFDHLP